MPYNLLIRYICEIGLLTAVTVSHVGGKCCIILARLDLEEIFCDVDDFYQVWERFGTTLPQLPHDGKMKQYNSKLSISEVITITIAFHGSGFGLLRNFISCKFYPTGVVRFPIWSATPAVLLRFLRRETRRARTAIWN